MANYYISGAENGLRPCPHWRLIPEHERGPGFHPIPGIGLAVRGLIFWRGSDPVGEIFFSESEPAESKFNMEGWSVSE